MKIRLQAIADAIQQRLDQDLQILWDNKKSDKLVEEIINDHQCAVADLVELLKSAKYPDDHPIEDAIRVDTARMCVRLVDQIDDGHSALLTIGKDTELPWYVRQEALLCLAKIQFGRMPENFDWTAVLEIVTSRSEGEVRAAALDVLTAHRRKEMLSQIQGVKPTNWFDGEDKLLLARAALGDPQMLVTVIQKCFDPWTHKRTRAHHTLQSITESHGGITNLGRLLAESTGLSLQQEMSADEIWMALQEHTDLFVRRWALEKLSMKSPDQLLHCLEQLGHSDWAIRKTASDALVRAEETKLPDSDLHAQLHHRLHNSELSHTARSWSAYTLIRRGVSARELVDQLPSCDELWLTPWSFGVDQRVRNAIVANYANESEEGTDVRYQIEAALANDPCTYEETTSTDDRNRLIESLKEARVPVTAVQECGELYQQGCGTYWVIDLGDQLDSNRLYVSTLGPFVSFIDVERCQSETSSSTSWDFPESVDDLNNEAAKSEMKTCHRVAEECGYIWIDGKTASQFVPGLNVYFFGNREPLMLRDLIYYWQD